MGEMTSAELAAFGPFTIMPDDVENLEVRLAMLPKRTNWPSSYLVFVHPTNAKIKSKGQVINVWPEVCIALLNQVGDIEGSVKTWDVRPTLRNGSGWRKKPVARIKGRDDAAMYALNWTARENWDRATPKDRRIHKKRKAVKTDPELYAMAVLAFDAYMQTYDNFSSDSKEISGTYDITMEASLQIGKLLENADLIQIEPFEQHGGLRVSGPGIKKSRGNSGQYESDTWQCFDTYDSINRLEAIDRFIEKCPDIAEVAKGYIAKEHKKTRKQRIDVYGRVW